MVDRQHTSEEKDGRTVRYKIIPVGHEFRVADLKFKRWADDGYYESLTDAQHARDALVDDVRL